MDKISYSFTISKNGIKQATLTGDTCNKVVSVRDHNTFQDADLGRVTSGVVLKQFDDTLIIAATGALFGI